jgi:hypothetical protein
MTEPDEALRYARESAYQRALEMLDGDETYVIEWLADTYRAGQAASAERIKALEEDDLLEWMATQHMSLDPWQPEQEGAARVWLVAVWDDAEDYCDWRRIAEGNSPREALANARALLKEADQ